MRVIEYLASRRPYLEVPNGVIITRSIESDGVPLYASEQETRTVSRFQAIPDDWLPHLGGWNRFQIGVQGLKNKVKRLWSAEAQSRYDIITGVGGMQILMEDPASNPIKVFEPAAVQA